MSNKTKLILLYGGKSGEHEVSLVSAAAVLAHLDESKYTIFPIGIDKTGCFFSNDLAELKTYTESLPVKTATSRPLASLMVDGRPVFDAEVVFPVVHGPLYEDGCLQGLLELGDVAYVGCSVLPSAICMDKDMARRLLPKDLVDFANYKAVHWHATAEKKEEIYHQVIKDFGWPLFVKPCSLGSSVGIHKVNTLEGLREAVNDALNYDETVLIEEFIKGREIELAVLESMDSPGQVLVSTAGEIVVNHADGFYSYIAKYIESKQTDLIIPAAISDALLNRLQHLALQIFTQLKCQGMARVDFFVDVEKEKIIFNEINSLPGFTPISMYPKLWQASGISYPQLLDKLIQLAVGRHARRKRLVKSYQ